MTDKELNELVAKELGWEMYQEPATTYAVRRECKPGLYEYAWLPNYVNNIKAAWEIVEKATEYNFHLEFHNWNDDSWFWEANLNDVTAEADTAPRAIVLAFLKLRGKL